MNVSMNTIHIHTLQHFCEAWGSQNPSNELCLDDLEAWEFDPWDTGMVNLCVCVRGSNKSNKSKMMSYSFFVKSENTETWHIMHIICIHSPAK